MHSKSWPIKGDKLADGTNVIGRTIIRSKPLLTGTKLGKWFAHYYPVNESSVEHKGKESVGAGNNGRVQWQWESALECYEKPKTR
jgi:hypothetical protein